MNFVVIPARWSSSRLPGKPLKKIGSKPMIQWVYESCKKSNAKPRSNHWETAYYGENDVIA